MPGLKVIIKKEFSDHISSYRFLLLFLIIFMVSLALVYMAAGSMREELSGETLPRFVFLMLFTSSKIKFSLIQFIAYFGPLIGLMLGFDSVNRERNEGTLSKLLAQPIYRDTVIVGKFLAGLITITFMIVSIVLIITGLGLFEVGVKPGAEEFFRIIVYMVISIVYISLWLGVSILFSVVFRSVATSAMAVFTLWIFFSFFLPFGLNALINAIFPPNIHDLRYMENVAKATGLKHTLSLISPMAVYNDATSIIIDPMRRTVNPFSLKLGMLEQLSLNRFAGPLPLLQSVLIVAPYIVYLLFIVGITFIITYIVFVRQEIRSI